MAPFADTRKPVDTLEPADLAVFPIWEFATDEEGVEGQDETWIRPVDAKSIPRDAFNLVLAATFTATGGRLFEGAIYANTGRQFEILGAAMVAEGQYLPFCLPAEPFTGTRRTLATELGCAEVELFPLRFALHLPLAGEETPRAGTFP